MRGTGSSGFMALDLCRPSGPQAQRTLCMGSRSPVATLEFFVIWNKGWHFHFVLGPANHVAAPG